MTPDNLRRAARGLAKHRHLDAAAVVMAGCIAASSSTYPTPSAEERAELLAVAESSDGLDRFIEAPLQERFSLFAFIGRRFPAMPSSWRAFHASWVENDALGLRVTHSLVAGRL